MFVIMSDSEMVVMLHVWIILTAGVQAQDAYEIKDNGAAVSWQTARKTCSLASPNLNYSADDVTLDLDVKYPGLVERDRIWIGYAKVPQIFQYIGCVSDRTIWLKFPGYSHHRKSTADLGMCYSNCGNEYFGLTYVPSENVSECYCFDDDRLTKEIGLDNTEDGCTSSCVNPKDTACGGKHENGYFASLYKHVSNLSFVKDCDADYKCCAYTPSTVTYGWFTCKSRILQNITCEIDGTVVNKGDNKHWSWTNASKYCFKRNTYPVTYMANKSLLLNADNTFWTSMIRSDVIFKAKALPSEKFSSVKPGYITLVNNAFKLKFLDHKKAFLTNISLCYKDDSGLTDAASVITSPSNQDRKQDENSISVGLYAGIPAVLITLVVVILLLVFICRRRQRTRSKNETKTGRNGEDNAVAEDMLPIRTVQLPEQQYVYEITDFADEAESKTEDTYNTTVPIDKGMVFQTENVYNRLETGKDDIYNHTDSKQRVTKSSASPTVGIANVYNKKDFLSETADDEYSHVNVTLGMKNVTDNVYAKTKHVKSKNSKGRVPEGDTDSTYDMTGNNMDICAHSVVDSTYSHVHMQQ